MGYAVPQSHSFDEREVPSMAWVSPTKLKTKVTNWCDYAVF